MVISGSGNVAQYACQKATELGAKVVTMSDSSGFIYDQDGISAEKLAFIMDLKNVFWKTMSVGSSGPGSHDIPPS